MRQAGGALGGGLPTTLPTPSSLCRKPAGRWAPVRASATHGTVEASRGVAAALKTGLARGQWPAALHLAAASQVLNHYGATAASVAPTWGQHPGEAAWMTMASLFTLAATMSGVLYYMARTTWEGLEPYVMQGAQRRQQDPVLLYGVDISDSRFLRRPAVMRAAHFAAEAHKGQVRKTRQPYVSHCVETALIVEGLLSPTEEDERAEAAVIAALLHDVLDDTEVEAAEVEATFGAQVASMVGKVSQLSTTNQIVRRRLRVESAQPTQEEEAQLRNMILTMVGEPLVIAIKLADRLHNMRTVYALSPEKQRAVASETRRVWCSLAERLGMFALKSELEDLCFAVLQPTEYRALRRELDELWGVPTVPPQSVGDSVDCCLSGKCACEFDESAATQEEQAASAASAAGAAATAAATASAAASAVAVAVQERRQSHAAASTSSSTSSTRAAASLPTDASSSGSSSDSSGGGSSSADVSSVALPAGDEYDWLTAQQREAKELIDTVLPFDATTFNFAKLRRGAGGRRGLEVLQACAQLLMREIGTESLASGLEVSVQGRLKSLYSTFKKMARKRVPLSQVYDARALRVVVDDDGGRRQAEAIAACYKLLPAVHRLFRRVAGEEDDYIAQPKPSGYQSLHTAVVGPGGVPMEVQMRTSSMHSDAEYGKAAHWAYKESPSTPPTPAAGAAAAAAAALPAITLAAAASSSISSSSSDDSDDGPPGIQAGQPLLHIGPGGRFRDGVVVQSEYEGARLLCAISHSQRAAPDASPAPAQEYRRLLRYVQERGYFGPSQGDFTVSLELFTLCSDGKYHRLDRFGHKLQTVVVPLNLGPEAAAAAAEAATEAAAVAGALTGPSLGHSDSDSSTDGAGAAAAAMAAAVAAAAEGPPPEHAAPPGGAGGVGVTSEMEYMNNRIRLLRSMLEWGRELGSSIAAESSAASGQLPPSTDAAAIAAWTEQQLTLQQENGQDVLVLVWPGGRILRVPRGTTAGSVIRDLGLIEIQPSVTTPSATSNSNNTNGNNSTSSSSGGGGLGGGDSAQHHAPQPSGIAAAAAVAQQPRPSSSTSAPPAHQGQQGQGQALLVNVNNRLVPEETPLFDGDYVVLSRDRVKI